MKKRLFLGISISEELQQELINVASAMPFRGWKWTKASNLHITACFMGHIEEAEIDGIILKLSQLKKPLFTLEIEKITPVIRKRKLEMVWTTFKPNSFFNDFSISLHNCLNIPLEREPKPHITLARIKAFNTEIVSEEDFVTLKTKFLTVNTFHLYESVSGSSGPIYHILNTFSLYPKK